MEDKVSSYFCDVQTAFGEDSYKKLKEPYHRANILPLVKKACQNIPNPRILEFGPGKGVMAGIVLSEIPNAEYHAIDIAPVILEHLREKNPKIRTYLCNDYKELSGLELSGMDVVIALDVWEHLPHDELDNYTRYAIDALKPNGIFIAQVPNWGCPFVPNTIFASDLTHNNFFTEISARQLLMRNGVSKDCMTILPYKFPAGIVGRIRSIIRNVVLFHYRLTFVALGVLRVSIMTPNIIMIAMREQKA